MCEGIEITLFILAVGWDITSLILELRRNVKKRGPSGVPVISWLIYLVLFEWRKLTLFFSSTTQAGVVLTAFHILCHFAIPWLHRLYIRKTPMQQKKE